MPSTEASDVELRNLNASPDESGRNNSEDVPLSTRTPVDKMRLDPNVYATKKTIAQGMLDIALLTANASQLKYVLQVGTEHEFYYPLITMISISIILQILIGMGFLFNANQNINQSEHQKQANKTNNVLVAGIFLVTVLNVLIAAFGMKQTDDDYAIRNPLTSQQTSQ